VDECKPLATGHAPDAEAMERGDGAPPGRGLHSSTFQLNLSQF